MRPKGFISTKVFDAALAAPASNVHYSLQLFVTGSTPKSTRAIQNIRAICEKNLAGRYDLEVVDIYQHPGRAKPEQIAVTPTLVKRLPLPFRKLMGDLSNIDRVLAGLGIVRPSAAIKPPGMDMIVEKRGGRKHLEDRIVELQARLEEAEETLRALRNGEADAIIVAGPDGDQVYTLKGADETYRIMVEEMAEGAITLSEDGLILFANTHFAAMVRRPLERVLGARVHEFIDVGDQELVAALLGSAGRRKAEVRMVTGVATRIPVYISIQNLLLSGAVARCVIVTDLSDQKRYTEMAAVLEAVPVGVYIAQDVGCKNIVGNRMAYELLRVPDTAQSGRTLLDLEKTKGWRAVKDGRELAEEELPMQAAARTGQRVRNFEFDMLFDDGAYRSWLSEAVPLFDENGKPRGAVGAIIDITDRRRTAEALEAANVELRNFGNALTEDLREPLQMVVKFTKLLARQYSGPPDTPAASYIADALQGASRIDALLQALLEYWDVTERSGTHLKPIDCNELLSFTVEELRESIACCGAIITSAVLPTLVADGLMLAHVFKVLIGNAVQYRSEATPTVHISAENTYGRWLFTVRDNGIGIERQDAERVFGMFKRLHGNEIPGTGVGLALCRKAVERHGGRIWVESTVGSGSAFRFTIPAALEGALPGFSSVWPDA